MAEFIKKIRQFQKSSVSSASVSRERCIQYLSEYEGGVENPIGNKTNSDYGCIDGHGQVSLVGVRVPDSRARSSHQGVRKSDKVH